MVAVSLSGVPSRPNTDGRDDRPNDAGRTLASSLLGDAAPTVRPVRPAVASPPSPSAGPGSRQARRAARERIVAHEAARTEPVTPAPAPHGDGELPLGRRERRLLREEQERQALAREEARESERQRQRPAADPPVGPAVAVEGAGLRARARQRRVEAGSEPPPRPASTQPQRPQPPRAQPPRPVNSTQAAALAPGAFDYLPWLREDRVSPDHHDPDEVTTRFVRLRAAPAPPRPVARADRPAPRVRELVVATPPPVRTGPGPGSSAEPRPATDDTSAEEAGSEVAEESRRARRIRAAVEWTMVIGTAAVVALVLQRFVVQLYEIPSESMYPTLQKQDRVAVSKLSYDVGGGVERGDVIVFKRPEAARSDDPEQPEQLIKRVIGLPGDVVEARGGVVYIDGAALRETGPDRYLGSNVVTNNLAQPVTVPPGHVFVMGDNREHSFDSRFFGAIPIDDIIGRAVVVAWPSDRWDNL